tara:strand:+ start:3213 stop:3734 length:522 start_codon:yes stop_codon:yes gene_type:complete
VARKRRRWKRVQAGLDPHRLVFIDGEDGKKSILWIDFRTNGVKTNMAPLRGWGPKGTRVLGRAPHGKWRTLTFLAALRANGLKAPCVFDGPVNGEAFRAWVAQMLVIELSLGDIVVMDNLGSHEGAETRNLIRSAGARLWFLPPYTLTSIRSSRPFPKSSKPCALRKSEPLRP